MKIIFYIGLALVIFGAFTYGSPRLYTAIFFLLGYGCLSLFYLIKTIGNWIKKEKQMLNSFLQILCILMSVTLFSKYYKGLSLDHFSLFVVPFFIITSIIYLIKGGKRYTELTLTIMMYFYLSLPLFGIVYKKNEKLYTPRHYIPEEGYKPSTYFDDLHPIKSAYSFKTDQAKRLYQKVESLKSAGQYKDAGEILSEIIAIEPKNIHMYFDLANCYGAMNKNHEAIEILDQAIAINDSLAYLFHNRGAMYYRLSQKTEAIADYQRAIELEPNDYLTYINLALVYCYQDKCQEAWEAIEKAEKLGGEKKLDNMSPDIRAIAYRWK